MYAFPESRENLSYFSSTELHLVDQRRNISDRSIRFETAFPFFQSSSTRIRFGNGHVRSDQIEVDL